MSSTAVKGKGKSEKSERQKQLEAELAALEDDDSVDPEEVPEDTQGELERVKAFLGAQFGFDLRSPGQVKQAEIDGLEAEIALEEQQAAEAKAAEEEAAAAEQPQQQPAAKAAAGA